MKTHQTFELTISESVGLALEALYAVLHWNIDWLEQEGYFHPDLLKGSRRKKTRQFLETIPFLKNFSLIELLGGPIEQYEEWGKKLSRRVFTATFQEKKDDDDESVGNNGAVLEVVVTLWRGVQGLGGPVWRFRSLEVKTPEKRIPWGYFP